ncbi:stage III sporulation protein AC [Herbinix hemicellulosilytica]|uniref:Putative membrane protein n=1 Tax=Herbinix hemicellulosilytica TaxID=1564487 RepID=A0A0H5SE31_HERHM|nr:stage III sporulation protein AC [Herbinix hemicellulosilytica]RBP57579.1 stage III sporulation protein AC [Herbinix hemicellulosilytica]CRZ33677.1 putative membrane protein [Herbinix hemicellulosilytica]
MEIYLIFRIAVVGILVSLLNQILKQSNRDELAFLTSLAGLLLVMFWLLPYINKLFSTIKDLFAMI